MRKKLSWSILYSSGTGLLDTLCNVWVATKWFTSPELCWIHLMEPCPWRLLRVYGTRSVKAVWIKLIALAPAWHSFASLHCGATAYLSDHSSKNLFPLKGTWGVLNTGLNYNPQCDAFVQGIAYIISQTFRDPPLKFSVLHLCLLSHKVAFLTVITSWNMSFWVSGLDLKNPFLCYTETRLSWGHDLFYSRDGLFLLPWPGHFSPNLYILHQNIPTSPLSRCGTCCSSLSFSYCLL